MCICFILMHILLTHLIIFDSQTKGDYLTWDSPGNNLFQNSRFSMCWSKFFPKRKEFAQAHGKDEPRSSNTVLQKWLPFVMQK